MRGQEEEPHLAHRPYAAVPSLHPPSLKAYEYVLLLCHDCAVLYCTTANSSKVPVRLPTQIKTSTPHSCLVLPVLFAVGSRLGVILRRGTYYHHLYLAYTWYIPRPYHAYVRGLVLHRCCIDAASKIEDHLRINRVCGRLDRTAGDK